mgnify:CR=1 FL=1
MSLLMTISFLLKLVKLLRLLSLILCMIYIQKSLKD